MASSLESFPARLQFALILCLVLCSLEPTSQSIEDGRDEATVESPQGGGLRFGVEVELVSIFATVLDSKGRLVTGLRQDDFAVYEDDVPQRISQFSQEYIPLSVVVLLDTSSSMSGRKLENARKSLDEFLDRLNPGDEAMLMTFRTRPTVLQPFSRDRDRIRRALKRLEARGSTALYDSILTGLQQSGSARNRRRALLLLSDGINTYGRAHLDDTVEQLRRRGAELFAIGLETNLPEDLRERGTTRAVLGELTRSAGGEAFIVRDPKELKTICRTISDRMHNQYFLGYYPPKGQGAGWRSVRLVSKVPGLRILPSKTGYYPQGARR